MLPKESVGRGRRDDMAEEKIIQRASLCACLCVCVPSCKSDVCIEEEDGLAARVRGGELKPTYVQKRFFFAQALGCLVVRVTFDFN